MNCLGNRALLVVLSMRRDKEGMLPGWVADSFTTLFSHPPLPIFKMQLVLSSPPHLGCDRSGLGGGWSLVMGLNPQEGGSPSMYPSHDLHATSHVIGRPRPFGQHPEWVGSPIHVPGSGVG